MRYFNTIYGVPGFAKRVFARSECIMHNWIFWKSFLYSRDVLWNACLGCFWYKTTSCPTGQEACNFAMYDREIAVIAAL